MKNKRQSAILKIISDHTVDTQEQLLEHLRESGFACTQATISRDIRDLHISKQADENGKYRYAVTQEHHRINAAEKLQAIFRDSVTSVDDACNIVVLKTMSGLANAAAAAVDSMNIEAIVGSLAGDDTVLLVLRSEKAAGELSGELREMLS